MDDRLTEGVAGLRRGRRHRPEMLQFKRFVDQFRFVLEEFPISADKEGGDYDDGSRVTFPELSQEEEEGEGEEEEEEEDDIIQDRILKKVSERLKEGDKFVDEPGGKEKMTPLVYACQEGNALLAMLLLTRGADVNYRRPRDGATPLMLASGWGNAGIVRTLLGEGARVDAVDSTGAAAVHHGAGAGQAQVVNILAEAGADLDATTCAGAVPLLPACAAGRADTVECIIKKSKQPNFAR